MARTEDMIGTEAAVVDAAMSGDASGLHADKVAAARKQVLEIARALARMAAREDDAAERNLAGRAKAEAAAKSAKRRAVPTGNG